MGLIQSIIATLPPKPLESYHLFTSSVILIVIGSGWKFLWENPLYIFLERILETTLEVDRRIWFRISGLFRTISKRHKIKMVSIPSWNWSNSVNFRRAGGLEWPAKGSFVEKVAK